jgi:hypothetical protein
MNVIKSIKTFIFGQRAKGEKIPVPTLRTVKHCKFLTYNQWTQELKVSRGYVK